jgi:predicted metal-binding protein
MPAVANSPVSAGSLENTLLEVIDITSPHASSKSKATVDRASAASPAKPAVVLELKGKEGLQRVCEGRIGAAVFDLNLETDWNSDNKIGDEDAAKLAAAMEAGHCSGLRDLNLVSYNNIGAEGAVKLAAAFESGHCSGLRDLNLGGNEIGDKGAIKLAAAIESGHCSGLRDLNLESNEIGAEGAVKLAAAMKAGHCSGLRDPNLGHNDIGDEGAVKLAAALEPHR